MKISKVTDYAALSDDRYWKPIFGVLLSGRLRQVLLYLKPVLNGLFKIDKTKVFMGSCSLMEVEILTSIKQQSLLKTNFGVLLSGRFRQVLLYCCVHRKIFLLLGDELNMLNYG